MARIQKNHGQAMYKTLSIMMLMPLAGSSLEPAVITPYNILCRFFDVLYLVVYALNTCHTICCIADGSVSHKILYKAGSFHTSGIRYPLDNFACRGLYQVYTGYRLTRGLVYLLARRS